MDRKIGYTRGVKNSRVTIVVTLEFLYIVIEFL